ncbi:MAG: hypothetical protein AAF202_07840, partial [Pseudomonadota bacterium]
MTHFDTLTAQFAEIFVFDISSRESKNLFWILRTQHQSVVAQWQNTVGPAPLLCLAPTRSNGREDDGLTSP